MRAGSGCAASAHAPLSQTSASAAPPQHGRPTSQPSPRSCTSAHDEGSVRACLTLALLDCARESPRLQIATRTKEAVEQERRVAKEVRPRPGRDEPGEGDDAVAPLELLTRPPHLYHQRACTDTAQQRPTPSSHAASSSPHAASRSLHRLPFVLPARPPRSPHGRPPPAAQSACTVAQQLQPPAPAPPALANLARRVLRREPGRPSSRSSRQSAAHSRSVLGLQGSRDRGASLAAYVRACAVHRS